MLKCPFCNYQNEDGALFCEQCKSDLASAAAQAVPVAAAVPVAEAVPMAAVVEDVIPLAAVEDSAGEIPVAIPMAEVSPAPMAEMASPVMAAPIPSAPPAAPVAPPAAPAPAAAPPPPAPSATGAAPAAPPAAAPAAAPAMDGAKLPADAKPRLVVLRGQKINQEFPIYDGLNFIGRADEKPVDIDLEDQEPPDRVWCSRQHALISFEEGVMLLEDLSSANGTYVNRARIYPGQKRQLIVNDVIQIGTVQLKVKI